MRMEIPRATGLENEQLRVASNCYGKRFLLRNPQSNFNIAHIGSCVACAVADEPVGTDIELMKSINLRIAERFLLKMKQHIF